MARNVRYEDIHVGDKASLSKTISEYDVYAFAGVTGGFQSGPCKCRICENSLFKQRIAHGHDFSWSYFGSIGNRTSWNRYDLYEPGTRF